MKGSLGETSSHVSSEALIPPSTLILSPEKATKLWSTLSLEEETLTLSCRWSFLSDQ